MAPIFLTDLFRKQNCRKLSYVTIKKFAKSLLTLATGRDAVVPSIIEHPCDVFTRPPAINNGILSTQWRTAGEILPDLLDRKQFGFSILPVVITKHNIHLFYRRPVTRIKVCGDLWGVGLEFVQSVRLERWFEGRANCLAGT